MKCKLSTGAMKTLFNQSIGRLHLKKTRSLILASLLAGVLVTLVSAPMKAGALDRRPADTFSVLLKGPYKAVVHGPNLGLLQVDLSDGSYSKTKIFPVNGLPVEDRGHGNDGDRDSKTKKSIGTFYVQSGAQLTPALRQPPAFEKPGK